MKASLQPTKLFSAAASTKQVVNKAAKTIVDNRPRTIAQRKLQEIVHPKTVQNPLSKKSIYVPTEGYLAIQRMIKIGTDEYTKEHQREFIGGVMHQFPRFGFSVPAKLCIAIAKALGSDAEPLAGAYNDYEHFLEKANNLGLTSADPSGRRVTHSATNLGSRPKFAAAINAHRTIERDELQAEGHDETQAARHIIPSHLLGYVAEKLPAEGLAGYRDDIQAFLLGNYPGSFEELDVSADTIIGMRRSIWVMLHNNPSNLWIGDSLANSAIGFLSGSVENLMERIMATLKENASESKNDDCKEPELTPQEKAKQLLSEFCNNTKTKVKDLSSLGEEMNGIKNLIVKFSEDVLRDFEEAIMKSDNKGLDNLAQELNHLWLQIECDPPQIGYTQKATDLAKLLQSNSSIETVMEFLNATYTHTLAQSWGADVSITPKTPNVNLLSSPPSTSPTSHSSPNSPPSARRQLVFESPGK